MQLIELFIKARKDAWINFGQWTQRPSWEWGSYVNFPTIEEWMEAQWIALSRWGWDINKRLQAWVWTGEWPNYAKTVMWWAWIPNWTKFSDLTEQQKNSLQMSITRKESPGLFKILQSWSDASSWWPKPTPAELAMFEKWAQYIWSKWWLSAARYNQIAEYQKTAWQDILNTYEPTFKNESQSKSFEYANRMIPSLW
jgi:hypothetical protein